jgi:hypothetical protein
MKTKRIILGLSILAISTICTINVQSTFSMSNELGYASIADLITLNSANAESDGEECNGNACTQVQGNDQGDGTDFRGDTKCCADAFSSGKKSI